MLMQQFCRIRKHTADTEKPKPSARYNLPLHLGKSLARYVLFFSHETAYIHCQPHMSE